MVFFAGEKMRHNFISLVMYEMIFVKIFIDVLANKGGNVWKKYI